MNPIAAVRSLLLITGLLTGVYCPGVFAETVNVAVASSFQPTAEELVQRYRITTGHSVVLSTASTAELVKRIERGIPYTILLVDDSKPVRGLEEQQLAVPGASFTYALGRLALASVVNRLPSPKLLRGGGFKNLGVANSDLCSYGQAAEETLAQMGLWTVAQPKLVTSPSIGETFLQVASSAVDLGFVALPQVLEYEKSKEIYFWPVPAYHHKPIEHRAVLLEPGRHSLAAKEFLAFLQSETSRKLMESRGYGLPTEKIR